MTKVNEALKYASLGLSVIPTINKKAIVKWTQYQKTPADENQIIAWWNKNPNADVAIVTGAVSGLTVVDADSEAGKEAVEAFLPDSLPIPTVRTQRGHGYHFYFQHVPGVPNEQKTITDTDIKNDGGYVVAPSGNGKYKWLDGTSIFDTSPPEMPSMLVEILRGADTHADSMSACYKKDTHIYRDESFASNDGTNHSHQSESNASKKGKTHQIGFTQGLRDNTLFHLANCLVKGGMDAETIRIYLDFIASHCTPPFPQAEIDAKIKSAIKRSEGRNIGLTERIRDFIANQKGIIDASKLIKTHQLASNESSQQVRTALRRLEAEGLLEKTGRYAAEYVIVERDCNEMDILSADENPVNIYLPMSLSEIALIYPGDIIVYAGVKGAGKTTWLLNTAISNMDKFGTTYFSSEIGRHALRRRLNRFDVPIDDIAKKVKFKECPPPQNLHNVIDGGEGKLIVVDYMEVDAGEVFKVGNYFRNIHGKLNGAIAVVGLQMHPGKEVGMGAGFSLDKPNLYITLKEEDQRCKNGKPIYRARIHNVKEFPEDLGYHPQGRHCLYQVQMGYKLKKYPPVPHWRGWVKD